MKKQSRNLDVTAPAQKVMSLVDHLAAYLEPLGFNNIGRTKHDGRVAFVKKSKTYENFGLMITILGKETRIVRVKYRPGQPGYVKTMHTCAARDMEETFLYYYNKLDKVK